MFLAGRAVYAISAEVARRRSGHQTDQLFSREAGKNPGATSAATSARKWSAGLADVFMAGGLTSSGQRSGSKLAKSVLVCC